jgi:methylmalonyl-CoA/ethylmalonyl-CoA epimerase
LEGVLALRLHHVGIAVPDIPRAAADFISQFGYRAVSGIIHDPLQTAFVQFFRVGNDQTLLELVAPDGPESKLSAATKRHSGLHHLCYAVNDICGACGRLNAEGMVVIQEPVPAVAFPGRRIAWLLGRNRVLTELVEEGKDEWTAPAGQ